LYWDVNKNLARGGRECPTMLHNVLSFCFDMHDITDVYVCFFCLCLGWID
jgi:hypothetical protein